MAPASISQKVLSEASLRQVRAAGSWQNTALLNLPLLSICEATMPPPCAEPAACPAAARKPRLPLRGLHVVRSCVKLMPEGAA